jgi:hypothetical protein
MLIERRCQLLVININAFRNDNPLIMYWIAGSGSGAAKGIYGRNVGYQGRSEGLYGSPRCAWKYVSYGFYTVNRKLSRLN